MSGLPHPSYFPFDTLEAKGALPNRFKPTANTPVNPPSKASKPENPYLNDPTETHVLVPHQSNEPNLPQRIDLNTALQYGTAQGYPPLYLFIREFALTRLHPNIPYKDGAEVILTCGSTDGFAKTIECFTNPWTQNCGKPQSERPGLLCEEFAYMNAIQTAAPRGINIAPVAVDAEGMVAHGHSRSLYSVLSNWDVERDGGRRPHLMYSVTMGQNPTSGLLSVKRRKEIYELCQRFDIIIVEDDPYFYIQFPHAANEFTQKHRNGELASINHFAESNLNYQTSLAIPVRGSVPGNDEDICQTTRIRRGKSSGSAFLDSLVPSYLSLDVDGRVVRLDTFSKTIAPGCRLGWITAQPKIIERILRITETSTQQPSGFVQSLVAELLIGPNSADHTSKPGKGETQPEGWKMDGWIRWLEGLRGNYERRMQVMCEALEEGKCITTTRQPKPQSSKSRKCLKDSEVWYCPHWQCTNAIIAATNARKEKLKDEDGFEVLHKVQIYDFVPPMAGMFAWVHFNLESHPLAESGKFTQERLARALWIFQTMKPYLVLTAPGTIFGATPSIRTEKAWQYFRLCFAAIDEKEVKSISERFVRAAHDFWDLKARDVQKLLDSEVDGTTSMQERMSELSLEAEGKWFFNPVMC